MIKNINHPFFLSLRNILKFFIKPLLFICKGFRIEGKKTLPRNRKPCIIISNHAAFIDSVYFICSIKPRFTICGAKPKYFKTFLRRIVFRTANVLKIEDRLQFLEDCGTLLKAGEVILVYPEMGRNPEGLTEFKSWAAEVAIANRVPVIPCYMYGTTIGHKGKKRLIVGDIINPSGSPEELTRKFYEKIENLHQQYLEVE
ncbi:MAG: 1-acyl-sn-glycerol-3-phosphate acyltransferase [Candidatus Aminicenantes bacterium]|nr:1-acyl-sn-glycerol-3-phosphate acyltransferase [Candidatus Aminicenantes bacterium]